MEKPQISVSLMCMDILDMKHQLNILDGYADGYHIDIMDGHFCKNITLSPEFIKVCKSVTHKPIDVHLMTTDPDNWIGPCAQAGAQMISVHGETINTNCFRILNLIHSMGCEAGVTLNPATPLLSAETYLSRIDVLTIMTVDVGYAGQEFIPEMLDKIRMARDLRKKYGYHYKIMVDGGCNAQTYHQLYRAGAEEFVLGSTGLFGLDEDLLTACEMMKQQLYGELEAGVSNGT